MALGATNSRDYPRQIPGFAHIARYWDKEHDVPAAKILPGEYYVSIGNELISTVLGSCVSACIRDPLTGIGGMNHFMLPGDSDRDMDKWGGNDCLSTRYGVAAMESLINDILKQGTRKSTLEVKLFGGGEVLKMETNNVGKKNVQFVREFVRAEGLQIAAEDLGGPNPRKVIFMPGSGRVLIRRLRTLHKIAIADQEKSYARTIEKTKPAGDIELFD